MLEDSLRRARALAFLLSDAKVREVAREFDGGIGGVTSGLVELLALEIERAYDAVHAG